MSCCSRTTEGRRLQGEGYREGDFPPIHLIIIMVHLRMQPEGYGAAIYTFELQSLIASSSPRFLLLRCCEVLLLRCCEVLLFCRLVSVLLSPSDGRFLVSSGLRGKASCRKEKRKIKENQTWMERQRKERKGKEVRKEKEKGKGKGGAW